jgi:hypothetical protein
MSTPERINSNIKNNNDNDDCIFTELEKNVTNDINKPLSIGKVMNIIILYTLKLLCKIDKFKVLVYIIYFLIYFILYYSIIIPRVFNPFNPTNKKPYIITIIVLDVFYFIGLILLLVYYFKNMNNKNINTDKFKIITTLLPILITGILVAFNVYIYNEYLVKMSESPITKAIYGIIAGIFYIIFLGLFTYNINSDINIEFFLSLQILLLFFVEYILTTKYSIKNIYNHLKNDDFSTITTTCFSSGTIENYSSSDSTNNQLEAIATQYGENYLKTIGNIPIAFLNSNTNEYQDLVLADFYYPGSYYSYLANSPLNGTPNLDALKIALTDFKCRIIHLDVYSDSSDPYDPNSNPVIRCENMSDNAKSLSFSETMGLINKYAWINNDPNNLSYPLFLYLNFNFDNDNINIYMRIYETLLKVFSKYFIDKKYSFSGRNSTFSVSLAKMSEALGKIIIVSNVYPTKTALDELINASTNGLNNNFTLNEYKENYIKFPITGVSQDNNKNILLNTSKSNINLYYSVPNIAYKNNNQAKAGVFNPSFQDCAQYGIQGTLMYVFTPDDNLNKWVQFFKNKNDLNPVLKDELLRSVSVQQEPIQQQNPVVGLQNPQKYCVVPGLISTKKSNLSSKSTNVSCN